MIQFKRIGRAQSNSTSAILPRLDYFSLYGRRTTAPYEHEPAGLGDSGTIEKTKSSSERNGFKTRDSSSFSLSVPTTRCSTTEGCLRCCICIIDIGFPGPLASPCRPTRIIQKRDLTAAHRAAPLWNETRSNPPTRAFRQIQSPSGVTLSCYRGLAVRPPSVQRYWKRERASASNQLLINQKTSRAFCVCALF